MKPQDFDRWVATMEAEIELNFCRYCGAELKIGEVDICDGCFDSEQLRC